MTTQTLGTLPCPECGSIQPLKSDNRKHTLKCHDCGTLVYYQTQDAKRHIEQRLKEQRPTATQQNQSNTITLALPEDNDTPQRYVLTIQRMNKDEPITLEQEAANDDELIDSEDEPEPKRKGGLFDFDLFG